MDPTEYMLPAYEDHMQRLTEDAMKLEEEVLGNVLRQLLGREPDLVKDKGCVSMVHYPNDYNRYGIMTAEGVLLGHVHKGFVTEADRTIYKVEFRPATSPARL